MANIKKKVLALIFIICSGSLLMLISARGANQVENIITNEPISQPRQPKTNTQTNELSLSLNDSNSFGKFPFSNDNGIYPLRVIFAILFVAALCIFALFLSKKLLPGIRNLPGKKIRIIETAHLAPRRSVHLIEIGNRQFLIGSTNEHINTLADLTELQFDLTNKET
jgi:flagellar biosynthetic protein FliO